MITSETCSLLLQLWGLLVTAIIAAKTRSKSISIPLSVVIMVVVNIVGQMIIAGEGPAACLGFIVLPIYGCVVALIAVSVSNKFCRSKIVDKDIQLKSNSNVESQSSENQS
jgi:hypothetical protein